MTTSRAEVHDDRVRFPKTDATDGRLAMSDVDHLEFADRLDETRFQALVDPD